MSDESAFVFNQELNLSFLSQNAPVCDRNVFSDKVTRVGETWFLVHGFSSGVSSVLLSVPHQSGSLTLIFITVFFIQMFFIQMFFIIVFFIMKNLLLL